MIRIFRLFELQTGYNDADEFDQSRNTDILDRLNSILKNYLSPDEINENHNVLFQAQLELGNKEKLPINLAFKDSKGKLILHLMLLPS